MSYNNMSGTNKNRYTYDVTFGVGSLGLNLQSSRGGTGAYVDSFYRPAKNTKLPAEDSGYIKLG